MPQDIPQVEPQSPPGAPPKAGRWTRFKGLVTLVDSEFSFVKGLSLVTLVSGLAGGYFQYVTAYQDKVKTAATQQITSAETTYADISTMFSKAITLQQYLFFDYRDAVKSNADGDDRAIYTKNARAIFQQYDDLRISLRENIDLLARRVEKDLDWNSDTGRDAAKVKTIGTDRMTRLALGHYDFACDSDRYMPSFKHSQVSLPPTADMLKDNPKAEPLFLDWYSAKHQLLVLYYCFEVLHRRIAGPLAWASSSTVDPGVKDDFKRKLAVTQDGFDREAIRLNSFTTLSARRIEEIQVKFRTRSWYCHIPVLREVIDGITGKCSPIHTAQVGSMS